LCSIVVKVKVTVPLLWVCAFAFSLCVCKAVPEMTYTVSGPWDVKPYSLTHSR